MRAANPADADAAIDRLKDIGYLDDQRFAESYAAARVENEGFGRMRVLNDLRARRVSGEMAEQAVEHALGEKSEAELIDAFIERRMPSVASGGQNRGRKKAGRRLPEAAARGIHFGPDPGGAEAHRGPPGSAGGTVGRRRREEQAILLSRLSSALSQFEPFQLFHEIRPPRSGYIRRCDVAPISAVSMPISAPTRFQAG